MTVLTLTKQLREIAGWIEFEADCFERGGLQEAAVGYRYKAKEVIIIADEVAELESTIAKMHDPDPFIYPQRKVVATWKLVQANDTKDRDEVVGGPID